ncbi:MAG: sn-glycerol-3-phosphate ABC transporter ATP-binding protein UgpC [Tissierellia bacterium]|nr:sn-glycerol-3-phosphate ABC transporter ATP-binding protein UgpC [Tissierellia bacterium]
MAKVRLNNVSKKYENGFHAVKNQSMDIDDKEFIVLVGPSGCGKSTTLRMIAGLEDISDGELYIGDQLVNQVPAKDRDIAMVFQSYALYPHMTVAENIAFSLKLRGVDKEEQKRKVEEAAKILQLEDHLNKKPGNLSGGQRQRVALGRAMVRNPKVFLLDEPLSNLDAKLRVAMRSEIVDLHRRLETTFIYVTHDQTEAMTMGTRIAVLNAGVLEQFDTPANLYDNPVNKFVAEFIGSPQMTLFEGSLHQEGDHIFIRVGHKDTNLDPRIASRLKTQARGQRIYIGVRPEDMSLSKEAEGDYIIRTQLHHVEQVGSDTFIYFKHPHALKECCGRLSPAQDVNYGEEVSIALKPDRLYLFDRETEESILGPRDLVAEA